MKSFKNEWVKADLMRPQDNIISHVHLRKPCIFTPSYELEDCPISMSMLLSMEYARIWTHEKNEFVKDRVKKANPKFIKNDYWKWIEKRKPKEFKSCEAQGLKNFKMSNQGKNLKSVNVRANQSSGSSMAA